MKSVKASLLLALTLTIFCLTSRAATYVVGGPIVNPSNGHGYYLLSQGSWLDAETYAQTLGGHLATINDASEDAWIYSNVMNSDHAWIGLIYNAAGSGSWGWINGETSPYLNWAPGEPNFISSGHYYGLLLGANSVPSSFGSHWNNAPNADPYYAIVEVVPEPSTISLLLLVGAGTILARRKNA
jgi:hypothetical protein